MVWKIILAILFFSFMIFAHEFGHFISARMFKVGVKEFSIGMGPKIISKRSKKSGTLYALRLFPIGGFVSLVGEDEHSDEENALNNKPWYQRFVILFAGSFMNILTAVLAMFIILASSPYYASCTVADSPNYPLEESVLSQAGILDGDKIVDINGEKMNVYQDISYKIMMDGKQPLDITVERDGKLLLFEDIQFPTDEEDGMVFGLPDFSIYAVKKTLPTLIRETFYESFSTVKVIYSSIKGLVTGQYGVEAVSGPVGTVNAIAESAEMGVRTLATLFVFISMNLGIFNLLPFPALDGGRLVFVLIEAIRRKPIKPEHEGYVHLAGMAILLLFMAFITFKDILKLF
jgi:regulator of sigma E protease